MTVSTTETSILFAGTGNAFGDGQRAQACFHVRNDRLERNFLIDCGATSLSALKKYDADPNEIATILVSHLHGDHFGGIPYLILDGQFRRRDTDLAIIGPPGTKARLRTVMEALYPGSSDARRRFSVNVTELPAGHSTEVDGIQVNAAAAIHEAGDPALALRVTVGHHVIAYSGDTEWTETLIPLADDADILICEAYTITRPVRYHMHLPHLDSNRNRLNTPRIALVHSSPDVLAKSEAAERLTHDGDVLHL